MVEKRVGWMVFWKAASMVADLADHSVDWTAVVMVDRMVQWRAVQLVVQSAGKMEKTSAE